MAFLLIIGVSFAVMASRLTGFVSDYLYEQRIRQDSLSVEKLATAAAPLFESAASDKLNETLLSAGGEMGGRLLVVDQDGKVQFDTYARLMGVRLELPEVLAILGGGQSTAYGIHRLGGTEEVPDSGDAGDYVAYCASVLVGASGTLGALVYASPVAEMMDSLTLVEQQLITVFLAVAVAALAAAMVFSHLLTKPIAALTRTIQKMGKGDLSVRVPVKGSGELRELAASYNAMAEQLESLDKSRNQFVSNASHELKTPLATMKIMLESILLQPDMPSELRGEFLGDMNHEIDRLTSIVTDLLTLTRMDGGRLELHRERFNLSREAEETLRLLSPLSHERGIAIKARIFPDITVDGDPSKLGQVIYNLVENALKYTQEGGRVQVTLTQRSKNAVLTVQDNGIGIPREDQAHIFDRFYRVDKARSRETGGTGLGLSIVRQMVQLHGGTVRVDSEVGKGSTFTVELPTERREVQA